MPTTVSQILLPTNILTGSSSNLVPSKNMVRNFGDLEDYVELHVSDPAGKILYSIIPFRNYKIPGNFQPTPESISSIQNLQFNPKTDVSNFGLTYGNYNLLYNILRPKVDLSYNKSFFIKEISADRTEIRLINNNISQIVLENNVSKFINEFKSYNYFKEFYLNFGSNNLLPAVNVTYDPGNTGTTIRPASILIKLLNPLPLIYKVNTSLNIVDKISNSQAFNVVITPEPVKINIPTLRGPNFDLDLDNLRVGPTPYYNFNQVTTFNGEFAPQLQQLLGQLSASNFSINIDYDTLDYSEWVHFSSAARRLEGFQYKLTNIEAYNKAIYSASISTSPTSQLDIQLYQNKLNSTIQSFDDWEQYLFYESGSYAWPKQNSTKPYRNYSVTSSQAINWYIGNYNSASLYDDNNQNYLLYALPGYITENTDNELAFKFVASMGQMFDDIWIYIKAITDLYKAKNALDQGISKDLVYFALQSMGINTYTDEDGNNVFQYLYGVNEDGTYKPITGSYETLISASNYQLSGQDQQKGIYKRLYHNLPLLLKSKGTNRFIQYLNTIFGIPTTIMGNIEYGGVDKVTSSFEYEYDRFTYGLNMSGSSYIDIPWSYTSQSLERTGYNDIVSNGIEFRFKAFTTASNILSSSYDTQCIFSNYAFFGLYLKYKQTGSNDSIYSGSTGNFGYLNFQLGYSNFTSSTVPIFETGSDGETSWYSVLIQRRNPNLRLNQTGSSQTYDLYIKSNVFGEIGHVASASFTTSEPYNNECWYKSIDRRVRFGTPVSSTISAFTGSLQELRLWSNYISESVFDSHVLNPESIEGNFTTSSYEDLTARFTLGNNLYTYNHSVITSVSSSAPDQNIQLWTASFGDFPNRNNYSSFVETYYADAANSGYSNPVTDKIRIYSGSEYGKQLMPHKSIEVPALIPITKDIHLLDASLSPQDEIDRAIIAQFGSTYSVDDIIGDPNSTYQGFQSLQADFFKKFYTKYNYKDYIRLIDFFHNSLFRTLKDFTPARTNLATGIVIKPHLLERPVIYRPEPTFTHLEISGAIDTAFISGSNGGDYSQSLYDITYNTPLGSFSRLSDARDFFTGELPSASIDVLDDQYNPFTQFKQNNLTGYSESIWYHDYNPLLNNVSSSLQSTIRKRSEYISTGSRLTQILNTASLQDFYYDYYRHAAPRYIGSQVNSIDYTFYNEEDITFRTNVIGSYGKSATIDKNTTQFAFFSEATSTGSFQLAFPEATNIYIKYLINDKGSLTELSTKNYKGIRDKEFWNLYQIQNIFKNGEIANISLFDAQNPDLQKELDGNKTIWHGGFKLYPVLWRVTNTTQIYFVPDGVSAAAFYDIGNYRLDTPKVNVTSTGGIPIGPLYFFTQTRTTTITLKVTYQPAQPLPGDIIATVVLTVQPLFNFSRKQETRTMNVKIPARINGAPNYSGTLVDTWNGFLDVLSWRITNIKPANGNAPSMTFDVADNQPWLIVDPVHKNIVSCSALLSKYYKLNDNEETNLFFSGSVLKQVPPAIPPSPNTVLSQSINNALTIYNSFCIPEYSFTLNPGDIVRFASGSNELETKDVVLISDTYTGFQAKNEYTIVEVYSSSITQPNEISYVSFKLDKNVDPFMTSSLNGQSVIHKYIFARKFPDETNVIIKHRKQPGLTSAGIIKNRNISLEVDEKVANIASDLKNKIFSTVLIP